MYSPVEECHCGCPEFSVAGSYANVHCWAQSLVIRLLKDSLLQPSSLPGHCVTNVNPPLYRAVILQTLLGDLAMRWLQPSLWWNPSHTTVQITLALPSSLCTFYVPFPPPPIRLWQFPPFPRGACLCLRGDCGRGGRGPDLHRGGKGAELPQRIPQGVWAADSPCVIIVLLGDTRSNVSFNRSTLAIQEGQDSFHNSECADDVGYVNKENKSWVFIS